MISYNAKREDGFIPEIGNKANWRWVLRDNKGNFLDIDRYRHDLKERSETKEIHVIFIGE